MLKNLPENGKVMLFRLLNRSWNECRQPGKTIIITILRHVKSPWEIKSDRPVSQLNGISKTLEALVTKKLKRWAAEKAIIPPEQSGLQPGRMTVDVLANIVHKAMDSLQEKKRTIIAAVDLKAAFDRVWRGLLRNLADYGLHPKSFRWLRSFLADTRAKVRWEESEGRCRNLKKVYRKAAP